MQGPCFYTNNFRATTIAIATTTNNDMDRLIITMHDEVHTQHPEAAQAPGIKGPGRGALDESNVLLAQLLRLI